MIRFPRIQAAGLWVLLLLSGCNHGTSGLAVGQPGLDVARAALHGGSPQIALQVAGSVLANHPTDLPALIVQGDALTELGQLSEAAQSYTAVLNRDPSSVDAHIGLGRLNLATNPSQAEAMFLKALNADPRNTTALNDLGIARDLQGRHADAQKAYVKALGIDPELHAAQVNLALSLAMSGDSQRAVQLLQPLAATPGASKKLRHDLAAVLAMGGNRAEAERILSADLTPAQIQQALADYAAARSGAPPAPAAPPTALQAVPMPPMAAAAVSPPRPDTAGIQVQFTAAPSEEEAQAAWQHLKERMPNLLAGREPMFIKATRDGQTFWRVRTDGFATVADGKAFCARVRAAGGPCMVYQDE